jgi:hypothetical protein
MPRADGPFKVHEKIKENAYELDLPADFGVSPTFNIADLKPHLGKKMSLSRGRHKCKKGRISGPITQARAHKLNNQVSSFLASYSSYLGNGNVCSSLLHRNGRQEGNRVAFTAVTFGFQNNSSL